MVLTGNGIFFPSHPGPMNGAVFTKIKIPLMPACCCFLVFSSKNVWPKAVLLDQIHLTKKER